MISAARMYNPGALHHSTTSPAPAACILAFPTAITCFRAIAIRNSTHGRDSIHYSKLSKARHIRATIVAFKNSDVIPMRGRYVTRDDKLMVEYQKQQDRRASVMAVRFNALLQPSHVAMR